MFNFIRILDKKRKKKFYLMTIFLLMGMLLDLCSLATLIPLIELILGNNSNFLTEQVLLLSNSYFRGSALFPFSVFVILIFTVKTIYSIYLTYRQNRFISNLIRDTSNKLFSYHLQQDYNYHIQNNSAEIIRSLNTDLYSFATYLRATLSLFTEIGFVSSTLLFLVIINPLTSMGVIIFFSILILIYYGSFKYKLNELGEKKQKVGLLYNKIVLESVTSIKEIKVNEKESFFEKIHSNLSTKLWDIDTTHNTLMQTPRYVLEFMSILSIFILLFFVFLSDTDESEVFSFLGVFIVSIFKLIPSANKILSSLQSLKFTDPALRLINVKLKFRTKKFQNLFIEKFDRLELKNVGFSYSQNSVILNDINLIIKKGEFVGIKGESGSGKTTLIDIILGLQLPKKGKLLINGKVETTFKKGYVPQNTSVLDISIRDNVAFGIEREKQDSEKIIMSLRKAEILSFFNGKEESIDFIAGENGSKLSGGQKQRIGLARALYLDPDVLLLDEPTSALDGETEKAILKTLQKLSGEMTIIIISHNESLLKGCQKIYKLENKNLVLC